MLVGDTLYVACTDGLYAYPYTPGMQKMDKPGTKILELPAGGYNNHWTRNVIANAAGNKLYVSVGSASNVAEHGLEEEKRRASILEINPDGSGERIFASGLRNPNGMDWEPTTGSLWTVVNERDLLGDDLVPDYLYQSRRARTRARPCRHRRSSAFPGIVALGTGWWNVDVDRFVLADREDQALTGFLRRQRHRLRDGVVCSSRCECGVDRKEDPRI